MTDNGLPGPAESEVQSDPQPDPQQDPQPRKRTQGSWPSWLTGSHSRPNNYQKTIKKLPKPSKTKQKRLGFSGTLAANPTYFHRFYFSNIGFYFFVFFCFFGQKPNPLSPILLLVYTYF